MNGLHSALLGFLFLLSAALAFLPLLLASPLILLRGPKLLLSAWGVWLYFVAEGVSFWIDVVGFVWIRSRRTAHLRAPLSPPRNVVSPAQTPATPLPTLYEFNPEIPNGCARPDMTLASALSRTNSSRSAMAQQDNSRPSSRRPSSTLDTDDMLQMADSLRDSSRDDFYMYEMSPEGASRLSSRRSSRAASTVDLRLQDTSTEFGVAPPRSSRSRTGSFTFTSSLRSRNASTTSLGAVPESPNRHKRARTEA